MSKTREQRVEEALAQLVEHTLPTNLNDEPEDVADQQYYAALDSARELIDRCAPSNSAFS